MVAIIVIALVFAVIAEIATASRQIWSFARDKGLPFSSFLSKVRTLSRVFPSLFQDPHERHHARGSVNARFNTSLPAAWSNTPNQNSAGLPKLSHPPQRSPGLLPLRCRHQPDQPRLLRRTQCHCIPYHFRPPGLLYHIYRLHPLQASTW